MEVFLESAIPLGEGSHAGRLQVSWEVLESQAIQLLGEVGDDDASEHIFHANPRFGGLDHWSSRIRLRSECDAVAVHGSAIDHHLQHYGQFRSLL